MSLSDGSSVSRVTLLLQLLAIGAGLASAQRFAYFDAPNSVLTVAYGINSRGDFVGYYDDTNHRRHGFLVQNGAFTSIDAPSSGPANFAGTVAYSINSNNDMVVFGYNVYSGDQHYYVLSSGAYTPIVVPGSSYFVALGINNTGDIVGTYMATADGRQHGFKLSAGVVTTLDVPGAVYTYASGINNRGDIVGWFESPSSPFPQVGFLWHNGSYTTYAGPGPCQNTYPPGTLATASDTVLTGINDPGEIVGGYNDGVQNNIGGFYSYSLTITNGRLTPVTIPGAQQSAAEGINDGGTIVGSYYDGSDHLHGYIFSGR